MKTSLLLLSTLLTCCLFTACNNEDKVSINVSFADIPGVWKNEKTGDIVHVDSAAVAFYHSTSESCIVTRESESLASADEEYDEKEIEVNSGEFLRLNPEELNFANSNVFKKQDALSPFCQLAQQTNTLNPSEIFTHIWWTIYQYYPFLETREIDWQAQYNDYIQNVSDEMGDAELFALLAEMLSVIDDAQIELTASDLDAYFSPAKVSGWQRITQRWATAENIPNELVRHFIINVFNNVLTNTYALGELNTNANYQEDTAIAWARLEDQIAYLQVNTFEGYQEESESISAGLSNFNSQIESALAALGETSGLILDLRFNRGGGHELALTLASYFAGGHEEAFLTTAYDAEDPKLAYPFPENARPYTKPVTIIMSPSTQGAAELVSLSLRGLPEVTIMGAISEGAMSSQFALPIKPNWELRLPYQEYFSVADQQSFEAQGIPVDEVSPSTSFSAIELNLLPSIHRALENFGVDLSLSEEDYITQVEEIMGDDIPGFASAQISPENIDLHAFGFANLETGEATTIHTPFKVGSVSKTFIGTSASQMLQRGALDFDWTLEDIGFPIFVDGDHVDNSHITLQHLATHTSGIADGPNLLCAYVIDEGNLSLTGAFDIYPCPEPLTTDTATYLRQYLQQDGVFFSPTDNFTGEEAGQTRQYSNIGAALAAEALAHISGVSFEQWTQDNIFQPLGMTNTAWFNASYSQDNLPAQPYVRINGERIPIPRYSLATWADGDLRTSVYDLSRYLQAIINNGELEGTRILDKDSVDFMLQNQTNASILEDQGIFWFNDGTVMGHSGGDPGAMAHMFYDQFNQVGYITLTNISDEGDEPNSLLEEKFERLNYLTYRRGLSALKE